MGCPDRGGVCRMLMSGMRLGVPDYTGGGGLMTVTQQPRVFNMLRKYRPYYDYKVVCAETGKHLGWTKHWDARTARICWEEHYKVKVHVIEVGKVYI